MARILNQLVKSDESIMRQLWAMYQTRTSLKLINSFRGLPISFDAQIRTVNNGYIIVQTHPHQAMCVSLEKRTYIQGDFLEGTARAQPIDVDVSAGEVILTRITQAGRDLGQRLSPRVEPGEPVRVDIRLRDTTLTANLADLSYQGIGLYTFGAYINDRADFRRGDEVSFAVNMHGALNGPLRLFGCVTNISREQNSMLYRVGVQMTPVPEPQKLIQSYIHSRREEILCELDETYRTLACRKYLTMLPRPAGN